MIKAPKVEVNDSLTIQRKVTHEDTALNYGSGKLEKLFATPRLVALMIAASVKLIDEKLPEGFITIGKRTETIHEKPTVLGQTVSVKVTIKSYDGNKILLEMVAFDEIGTIGRGTHERMIVNKKSLLNRANKRAEKLKNKDF
ncbi:thioesterase family protein [Crassaminicella profunda]|uniref:thioesterase family protein n=1 Tax=Crassaminicella profunda TaxID=1286698 RepID=UPI001CA659AE|nr:dihydrolipoamide acyltransferase [Crassaminicella profunda]QZY53663.1 dihydrolipoamide acyltransferase [Crassaminicella profunda]